ncbi:MAG: hypothetical protein MUF84_09990 [Anaerolineae bacterium]|jgi:hypothetical protein|nr:hypothetical protein [Anaerolineae bacterium]
MSQLWVTVLVTLGAALFLSLMAAALAVPIRPDILRLVQCCVCPAGAWMRVDVSKASYHRPGERGLVATCEGRGDPRSVTGIAFFWLWVLFFAGALPVGAFVALVACACL